MHPIACINEGAGCAILHLDSHDPDRKAASSRLVALVHVNTILSDSLTVNHGLRGTPRLHGEPLLVVAELIWKYSDGKAVGKRSFQVDDIKVSGCVDRLIDLLVRRVVIAI